MSSGASSDRSLHAQRPCMRRTRSELERTQGMLASSDDRSIRMPVARPMRQAAMDQRCGGAEREGGIQPVSCTAADPAPAAARSSCAPRPGFLQAVIGRDGPNPPDRCAGPRSSCIRLGKRGKVTRRLRDPGEECLPRNPRRRVIAAPGMPPRHIRLDTARLLTTRRRLPCTG